MLVDLPNKSELYRALQARDRSYDGLAFVGVTGSRVFCRLSCSLQQPAKQDCHFFSNVVDCLDAGFWPCKHCQPLQSDRLTDPLICRLLGALERNPGALWREEKVRAMGCDPTTVRRAFKRQYGITFLELARLWRRQCETKPDVPNRLAPVSGFDDISSDNDFAEALSDLLGDKTFSMYSEQGLAADWIRTPIGALLAVADKRALYLLEFFDRKGLPRELAVLQQKRGPIAIGRFAITDQIEKELDAYFAQSLTRFSTPLMLMGSEFTQHVWQALQEIPFGQTRSYQAMAKMLCRPTAARAVARANGANQISIVVPCHRVLGADGSLTGYGGGLWRKQWLLQHERAI